MSIIVSDFTAIGAAVVLAAFATSSPELTVSATAAIAGQPEIGLGDALGSNVVNIALVFGLALLLGPIATKPGDFGRDFRLALSAPAPTLIVGSLALLMLRPGDGGLIPPSRGLMLLGLYVSALLAMLGSLGRMP